MSTNYHRLVGRRITFREDSHLPNKLLPGFPGWGATREDRARFMQRIQPGEVATITETESHGMAPFTRYVVQFADGSRSFGIDPAATKSL